MPRRRLRSAADPWNTTPAWRFPYTSPDLAPGSAAAPLISDGLGQQVLGLTGYVWFNDHVYAELGGYRSLNTGVLNFLNVSPEAFVDGTAPYWRLAYSFGKGGRSAEVGFFGMDTRLKPDPTQPGTDRYTDLGVDASYQVKLPRQAMLSFNSAFIHERRRLNASFLNGDASNGSGSLDTISGDVSYYWNRKYGLTAQLFHTWGSMDATLYGPEPDAGSRTGRPNTTGYTLQADWTPFGREGSWGSPWANLRTGIQFTGYTEFNGAGSNYDGFGRSARANNTLSLFIWTAF